MTKLERKKKRNEGREVAKSFDEYGRTAIVQHHRQMDERQQRRIINSLDEEAADAFKGLLRITDKAAETHAPVNDIFDSVRDVLTHVRAKEYKAAYRTVKAMVESPAALFKVRSILVRIGMDLAALARHQMGTAELEAHETEAALVEKINFALSEVTAFGSSDAENIEASDFDVVAQIEVELPAEIAEPLLLEGVTLLVLPDRKLREGADLGVRALASNTYLIEARLIGIPNTVPVEEREAAAETFARRVVGASITPISLSRPDSDATWFPLFKQRFAAELVHFPDQARRYYGTASAMSEQAAAQAQAKALRLQAVRAEFEQQNNELLHELREVTSEWEDARSLAKELREKFLNDTGCRWNTKFDSLVARYRIEHEHDLSMAGDDLARRWRLNQAFKVKIEALRERQNTIIETRARERTAKHRLTELEKQVAERKRDLLNPFRGAVERLANPAAQAA